VYLINLFLFLAVMTYVSAKQKRGDYQCESYTVRSKCPMFESFTVLLILPYIVDCFCLLPFLQLEQGKKFGKKRMFIIRTVLFNILEERFSRIHSFSLSSMGIIDWTNHAQGESTLDWKN